MRPHYSKGSLVGEAFFAAASAIEAYDREAGNPKGTYVTRLERTASTAGPTFTDLVGDVSKWATKVKELRNEVAHHDLAIEGAARAHFFGRSAHLRPSSRFSTTPRHPKPRSRHSQATWTTGG